MHGRERGRRLGEDIGRREEAKDGRTAATCDLRPCGLQETRRDRTQNSFVIVPQTWVIWGGNVIGRRAMEHPSVASVADAGGRARSTGNNCLLRVREMPPLVALGVSNRASTSWKAQRFGRWHLPAKANQKRASKSSCRQRVPKRQPSPLQDPALRDSPWPQAMPPRPRDKIMRDYASGSPNERSRCDSRPTDALHQRITHHLVAVAAC